MNNFASHMYIMARGTSDDFVRLNGYCPLQIKTKNKTKQKIHLAWMM